MLRVGAWGGRPRNGPHPVHRGQDEPIAALLLIPALIAAGLVAVWVMRARGAVIDPYQPRSVWARAGVFFVVAWAFSAATGTLGTILDQPIATSDQLENPRWIAMAVLCFVVVTILYAGTWASLTLVFDRRQYLVPALLFGVVWGLSTGQLLVSFYHLADRTDLPRWGVWIVAYLAMSAWQALFHDLFWDVYVSPEHDTPRSIRLKILVAHVPNVTLALTFLVIWNNYLLFVLIETVALVSATVFQRFPAPWAIEPIDAPDTEPGLLGLPHAAGFQGDPAGARR